jgi:hypothetical protein
MIEIKKLKNVNFCIFDYKFKARSGINMHILKIAIEYRGRHIRGITIINVTGQPTTKIYV